MSLDPANIGRFKVLGELGRGAMGVVYLAEDPRLKRSVAIKVVRDPGSLHDEILERFRREAEISAQLAHPNVVTIYDVGEEPGVGPYLAMEYMDGGTLAEELASGPMAPERAALVLVQAAHALEAVHGAGIVHRDIKPENFMLTKAGLVKLMDFGIARHDQPGLTTSGVFCTPAFAAPEILDRQPPSDASDRWAFAVTAFQCLSGVLPFQGDAISVVLFQISQGTPVYPEAMVPKVREVFERALKRAPGERHPDLRSFLKDLLAAMPLDTAARDHCLSLLDAPEASGLAATAALALGGKTWSASRNRRGVMWWAGGLVGLLLLGWGLASGRLLPRKLTVRTAPEGALAFLDDRPLGSTPLTNLRIPREARVLRLQKEGYVDLEHPLRPGDRTLDLALTPQPVEISLSTDPAGAEVFLDGVLKGLTPLESLSLLGDGTHRLMVRKAGYEPWTMTIGRNALPPGTITLKKAVKLEPGKKGFWGSVKKLFAPDKKD